MLDIKFMRENRDAVLEAMRALAAEDAPVAQALALDERRRAILQRVEVLRAERNSGSKQIGQLMRGGKRTEGQALQAHMSAVGDEIRTLDDELALAGGEDGLDAVREIVKEAPRFLNPGGTLVVDQLESMADAEQRRFLRGLAMNGHTLTNLSLGESAFGAMISHQGFSISRGMDIPQIGVSGSDDDGRNGAA